MMKSFETVSSNYFDIKKVDEYGIKTDYVVFMNKINLSATFNKRNFYYMKYITR